LTFENIYLTEPKRLDKKHEAILKFIKRHPDVTENQIVKAMHDNRMCSKITTLKKLRDLKDRDEIRDSLKEGESGFHKLRINYDNEFMAIDKGLSEIENIIYVMEENLSKITKEWDKTDENFPMELSDLFRFYVYPYMELMETIIRLYTFKTYTKIHSAKDLQLLYGKIIKLMLLLAKQSPYFRDDVVSLDSSIRDLSDSIHNKHKNNKIKAFDLESVETYAEQKGIQLDKWDTFIRKIDGVRIDFLASLNSKNVPNN